MDTFQKTLLGSVLGLGLVGIASAGFYHYQRTSFTQRSMAALDHAFRPYKGDILEEYSLILRPNGLVESTLSINNGRERLYRLCFKEAPNAYSPPLPSCNSDGLWVITNLNLGKPQSSFQFPGTYTILPDEFTYSPMIKHQGNMIRAHRLSSI